MTCAGTGTQRYRVNAEINIPTPLAEVDQPAVALHRQRFGSGFSATCLEATTDALAEILAAHDCKAVPRHPKCHLWEASILGQVRELDLRQELYSILNMN